MSASSYLKLPRPTLWLVKGDTVSIGEAGTEAAPPFEIEVASFYLSRAPVTNEEYEAFDPAHERPPTARGDRDPVVGVSFEEAAAYCRWYAEASGKPFRLPTEVEWEHACRGGTRGPFFWSGSWDDGAAAHVWHEGNAEGRCHEVETRAANPFGLHDLLGNVWEWTSSLFLAYPVAPGDGRDDLARAGERVVRGGSFRTSRVGCATRRCLAPAERGDDLGFRIVRSL